MHRSWSWPSATGRAGTPAWTAGTPAWTAGTPTSSGRSTALSKHAVVEAIGDTRAVHSTGEHHRAAVRATLFPGFGADRYASVIGALVTVRKEKLSQKLVDAAQLSRVLSESLPPLDDQDVTAVAEGFERLDHRRAEIDVEIESRKDTDAYRSGVALTDLRRQARQLAVAAERLLAGAEPARLSTGTAAEERTAAADAPVVATGNLDRAARDLCPARSARRPRRHGVGSRRRARRRRGRVGRGPECPPLAVVRPTDLPAGASTRLGPGWTTGCGRARARGDLAARCDVEGPEDPGGLEDPEGQAGSAMGPWPSRCSGS
jgi:hypothetical protein